MVKNKNIIVLSTTMLLGLFLSTCNSTDLAPTQPLASGIHELPDVGGGLIWSPNGKYLAGLKSIFPMPDFCWGCEEPHSEIFIIDLASMERRTILWTEFGEKNISTISWFPDGEHLAYTDEGLEVDWGIRSISADGEKDSQFMADNGYPVWNPVKPIIAMRDTIGEPGHWYPVIDIIDLSTGKREQVFKGSMPISSIMSLSWSYDGNKLAFSFGKIGLDKKIEPEVYFLDLTTKEIAQFTNDEYEYWSADFSPVQNIIALYKFDKDSVDIGRSHSIVLRDLTNNCENTLPILDPSTLSWSPDGQKLVVSSGREGYIVDLKEYLGSKFTKEGLICD